MRIKLSLLFLLIISTSVYSRIIVTDQPVDLLIVGKAYFGLLSDDGVIEYTDDGSFIINSRGFVVDRFGRKLYPSIKLPTQSATVNINLQGQVDAYIKGKENAIRLGQIALFKPDGHGNYIDITSSNHQIEIHQGKLYIK